MSKISRNDPCPCGSGKKYKKCCGLKEQQARRPRLSSPVSLLTRAAAEKGSPMAFARKVFKVLTNTARTPEPSSGEPSAAPRPKGFSTLEELIGIEGTPAEKKEKP